MFFARKKENDQQQIVSTLNSMVAKKTLHLTEALSAKQNFLNNISHEIRTPMQGILSISNELDEHWDRYSEQQRRSYNSDISSNSTRLMSLISDVIDLSALESQKLKPNLQKSNLVEFIIQIIALYELKHSNIKFEFKNELENNCDV
jgi:two-component system sensor histidine kinase ChiS